MKNKMKFLKLFFFRTFMLYLLGLLGAFAYFTYEVGPFGGLLLTDHLLIRGPVIRLLNPVTKDEKMIANFTKNRDSFEQLIQIKNEKCLLTSGSGPQFLLEHPETTALKEKIGLIKFRSLGPSLWFPDPYSQKASEEERRLHQEVDLKLKEFPFDAQTRKRSPEYKKFSEEHRIKICKHRAAYFAWEQYPVDALLKGVAYFPIEPKVAQGELYQPNSINPAQPHHDEKVLPSLDNIPTGFWRDQRKCVYRKIEAKWFLAVCPG
jgi:hypothetical protein